MRAIPIRKLSRLGNEFYLTLCLAARDIVPGRFEWGCLLTLLLKRCADDWVTDDGFRPPATIVQTSSINAMAVSLGRPYATIHRYVAGLIAAGWIMPVDGGVAISNDPVTAPRVIALLTLAHDAFVRLADDLADDLTLPAPTRPPAADVRRLTLRAALDVWLLPFEFNRAPVEDWTTRYLWIVIVVANVRHITADPVSSDRYAVDPTPDGLRRPISARGIAWVSGFSYGTVFRHCRSLADLDVIEYDRGGWLTVSRQLFDENVDDGVLAQITYYQKRIADLMRHGFDPARADATYIAGRPPYADIGG